MGAKHVELRFAKETLVLFLIAVMVTVVPLDLYRERACSIFLD